MYCMHNKCNVKSHTATTPPLIYSTQRRQHHDGEDQPAGGLGPRVRGDAPRAPRHAAGGGHGRRGRRGRAGAATVRVATPGRPRGHLPAQAPDAGAAAHDFAALLPQVRALAGWLLPRSVVALLGACVVFAARSYLPKRGSSRIDCAGTTETRTAPSAWRRWRSSSTTSESR